ncbi:CD5 antigen-like [Mustelus asterias]
MVPTVCLLSVQICTVLICGVSSIQGAVTPTPNGAVTPTPNGSCAIVPPVTAPPRIKAQDIRGVSLSHSRCSGQLSLKVGNSNVTVCGDGFSRQEADAVCRQLKCGSTHAIVPGSFFNIPVGTVWTEQLECLGSEDSLRQCHQVPRQRSYRNGSVGIVCSDAHFQLRLQGGADHCQGVVQLYYNGSWHEVSHSFSSLRDAELVCQRLQCGHAVSEERNETSWEYKTVHVKNWTCLLTEPDFLKCLNIADKPVGVKHTLHCSEGEVVPFRLVDGRNPCEGRTEVFHGGSWKPLCWRQWDESQRHLVCSQLECDRAEVRWSGPGMRGRNRTGEHCVKCGSRGVKMLVNNASLWDCNVDSAAFKQQNITCPEPQDRKKEVAAGLSGGVTACIVLVVLLLLLLLLSYGWKIYKRDGKEVFRRKHTQRQWIGPTGAASHAVSFHRNNNANLRPVSTQSADGNLYTGPLQKDAFSAYPALERRANISVNPRDNSSESDYDFFDTNAQRL